jgi:hypothetical protein
MYVSATRSYRPEPQEGQVNTGSRAKQRVKRHMNVLAPFIAHVRLCRIVQDASDMCRLQFLDRGLDRHTVLA